MTTVVVCSGLTVVLTVGQCIVSGRSGYIIEEETKVDVEILNYVDCNVGNA